MTAKIISICNQKGGIGKTTTTVNISAGLLHVGKGVLLIDMDPQANATINLLPQEWGPEFKIKDVFHGKKLAQAISPSVVNGQDIVPSALSFAAIESELISKIGRELILKKALDEKIKQKCDFIIIDTPPSLGMISINTFCTADEIIIPIHEFYALEGVTQLMNVQSSPLSKSAGAIEKAVTVKGAKLTDDEIEQIDLVKKMLGTDNTSDALRWCIKAAWTTHGDKIRQNCA